MDLAGVYRIFHPTSTQYTFISVSHGTFSKIDHILGHKASLSKYKKIEIIPCILSDPNALKLELNSKINSRKSIIQNEVEAAIVSHKRKVQDLMDSLLNSIRPLKKN
jgi:hypothetical protein